MGLTSWVCPVSKSKSNNLRTQRAQPWFIDGTPVICTNLKLSERFSAVLTQVNSTGAGFGDNLPDSPRPMCDRIDDRAAEYLAAGNSASTLTRVRDHSRTGRPIGDDDFPDTPNRLTCKD